MTTHRTFKRRVRARMEKTGESYTAARRMLIASGDHPEPVTPTFEPPVSDEAVASATGGRWDHWFEILDGWGATGHSHTQIARWLVAEQGVNGWWSQSITVAYERARGMRAVGQHADGWSVTATRSVSVPVERLFDAVVDDTWRARWLPHADLRLRTATTPRSARYDWEDGSTRVNIVFDAMGETRSRIALEHARLPDADAADEMKAWWRQRITMLKALLEAAPEP